VRRVSLQEKSERAGTSPRVVGFPGPTAACPICGTPLCGRQKSACSDRCRAAKSRRRRAQAQSEGERRVQELLYSAMRELEWTLV
jgi:predicted nucleic acid-binding Zn ribbon protein